MIASFAYPGDGLAEAPDIGMAYDLAPAFSHCKLFGTIRNGEGEPAGYASSGLRMVDGVSTLVDTWNGVEVTATISTAHAMNGKILGVDKLKTTTNESGYFEFDKPVKGLTFIVSCPSFAKTVTVDTTGHDSIDLSSYF